jgi:hypothetical protein
VVGYNVKIRVESICVFGVMILSVTVRIPNYILVRVFLSSQRMRMGDPLGTGIGIRVVSVGT